ncbi:hypothetical protein Rhe02_94740 [Rhizocola hellebori]|uniref:ATP synthase protein I n=1 Tax=Rhizocola hellebori TaxID=1392758 RepID=A0A8J3QKR0_9ACTN|nr:hypothetical protein [Rhizocola hellebori]GIH11407.1 hypothetical protein Rhe02_94740 [Rhizocola hellebori]
MQDKLRFVPFMLASSAVLAAVAALVGLIFKGGPGAAGAAAGVALMAALFIGSTVFIIWVESVSRQKMLVGGLIAYGVKLWILFVVLHGVSGAGWAGFVPMVFGVAAGVLGWIIAYAWWLWHAKILYVEP